jgi:hypothetical protein
MTNQGPTYNIILFDTGPIAFKARKIARLRKLRGIPKDLANFSTARAKPPGGVCERR